jgi:hypothetical protein
VEPLAPSVTIAVSTPTFQLETGESPLGHEHWKPNVVVTTGVRHGE